MTEAAAERRANNQPLERTGPAERSSKFGSVVGAGPAIQRRSVMRRNLFTRFYRAHAETITGTEGSGLGLSIVRETAESLGGRAWAEFPASGESVFAFSLPSRREEDAASAGTKRVEDKL